MIRVLAFIIALLCLAAPAHADLDTSDASVTPQLGQRVSGDLTFKIGRAHV